MARFREGRLLPGEKKTIEDWIRQTASDPVRIECLCGEATYMKEHVHYPADYCTGGGGVCLVNSDHQVDIRQHFSS